MSHAASIQPHHLHRSALVYIRQSTPKQLIQHQESTRRQYQLADRAAHLGWPRPRISIVDDDLGQSGTSSTNRVGFQRLVSSIGMGEVGLVLVTEVSRLSRLNSDWHRVLELCAVFETLIADDDGIYDPRDPNDRLLLGLKGTLFAAELHILRARMQQGLLNKARRGALTLRLPVGYRRLYDGTVVQDPDDQVRWTIHTLFARFALLHNARAVQRSFHDDHLLMPRYMQRGPDAGNLYWVQPTYQMITQILTNPVYAGMFVYGRRVERSVPGNPPRRILHRLPQDEWEVVVSGIYPAYIAEEQYACNREQLFANLYNFAQRRLGAPREGEALLQGLLICGTCGRRMHMQYNRHGSRYVCRDAATRYAARQCQSFELCYLDAAITACFFEAVQPAQMETLLHALQTLEQERQALEAQWQMQRERARYAVRLAQRQYDAIDPENRLVARELETRWNQALEDLAGIERDYAQAQRTELTPLSREEHQAIQQLAGDIPQLWQANSTTIQDRKQLLRTVIQEVTLTPAGRREGAMTVLWSGGMVTTHAVICPPVGWHCVAPVALVQRVGDLALTLPDHQIADQLNTVGVLTPTGKSWTTARITSLRKQHAIPTHCPTTGRGMLHPRGDGAMTPAAVAQHVGVSDSLINLWWTHGVLRGEQRGSRSNLWIYCSPDDLLRVTGQLACDQYPSMQQMMTQHACSAEEVWDLVKQGRYQAYRCRQGHRWQWRFAPLM